MKTQVIAAALWLALGSAHANDPKVAINALDARLGKIGAPTVDGTDKAGEKTVGALYYGPRKMNNNFDVVDEIKKSTGASATVFVKDGDHFIRVNTKVLTPDGKRGVGTALAKAKANAYIAVSKGEPFCGQVSGQLQPVGNPPKDLPMKVVLARISGWFAATNVGTRLSVAFAAVLVLIAMLGAASTINLARVNQTSNDLAGKWLPGVSETAAARASMLQLRELELKHAHATDARYRAEYEDKMKDAAAAVALHVNAYAKLPAGDDEHKRAAVARAATCATWERAPPRWTRPRSRTQRWWNKVQPPQKARAMKHRRWWKWWFRSDCKATPCRPERRPCIASNASPRRMLRPSALAGRLSVCGQYAVGGGLWAVGGRQRAANKQAVRDNPAHEPVVGPPAPLPF